MYNIVYSANALFYLILINVFQILSFSNIVCELTPHLGQYGLYELAVQNNTCNFRTMKNPTYPYTGMYLNIPMFC